MKLTLIKIFARSPLWITLIKIFAWNFLCIPVQKESAHTSFRRVHKKLISYDLIFLQSWQELHLTIETLEQSEKYIQSYRYFVIVNFELVSHLVLLFLLLIFSTIFWERSNLYPKTGILWIIEEHKCRDEKF